MTVLFVSNEIDELPLPRLFDRVDRLLDDE
jgi:hypothetical protein